MAVVTRDVKSISKAAAAKLKGDVTLTGGSNITLTQSGQDISIAATGGAVATDAIWDAKGDLAVGTGADTASKLVVGTNDQVLIAASGQATGLKWGAVGNADTVDTYHANATPTANNIPVLDANANLPYRDGWTPATGSWTYASASTITVPTGAASLYRKGDRIKWTQTTVKYGVIVAVADTLLTIAVNTDYTVANAAITLNYYSHELNPIGYPHWFTYAPTYSAAGSMTFTSVTTSYARFAINGNTLQYTLYATGTTGGSADNAIIASLPLTVKANGSYQYSANSFTKDAGDRLGFVLADVTNYDKIRVLKLDSANWGLGASRSIGVLGFYEF